MNFCHVYGLLQLSAIRLVLTLNVVAPPPRRLVEVQLVLVRVVELLLVEDVLDVFLAALVELTQLLALEQHVSRHL